ncbi:MAG: hypothetical protein Q9188_007118 [Gyalolechia gomerana]
MIVRLHLNLLLAGICMLLACVARPLDSDSAPPRPKGLERDNSVDAIRRSRNLIIARNHAPRNESKYRESTTIEKTHHQISSLSTRGRGGSEALHTPGKTSYDLTSRIFTNYASLMPITMAASYIEDFFSTIAMKIETGLWTNAPPTNYHLFQMWDFELLFFSRDTVIPWDFIQDYLVDTMGYVSKGFTGVYDEHMIGTINGAKAVVSVCFRLLRVPGSASGS